MKWEWQARGFAKMPGARTGILVYFVSALVTLGRGLYFGFVPVIKSAGKTRTFFGPDVPAAAENLRTKPGGEIRVWGSTELIRTLAEHDLVDEYRLAVYPLVLGTGKKLFSNGFALARLTLALGPPIHRRNDDA